MSLEHLKAEREKFLTSYRLLVKQTAVETGKDPDEIVRADHLAIGWPLPTAQVQEGGVKDRGIVEYSTRFGPFVYDLSKQLLLRSPLWTEQSPIVLPRTQHVVLSALLQHPNNPDLNRPVTYDELINNLVDVLGEKDIDDDFGRLRVYVHHIRSKLGDIVQENRSIHSIDAFRLIHSIRDRGYLFSDTYPTAA